MKKDLFSYICVFDDCHEPDQLYATSEEWLSHMSSKHQTRWHCTAKSHPPFSTSLRNDFVSHLETLHPGKFRKSRLSFIADSCARPIEPTISHCPFCSEDKGNLEAHVGKHLQYFALQSIPWPDSMDLDGRSLDTRSSHGSSDRPIRATLLDNLDDIPVTDVLADHIVVGEEVFNHSVPLLAEPAEFPPTGKESPEHDQTLQKLLASIQARDALASTAKDQDPRQNSDEEEVLSGHTETRPDTNILRENDAVNAVREHGVPTLEKDIRLELELLHKRHDRLRTVITPSLAGEDLEKEVRQELDLLKGRRF